MTEQHDALIDDMSMTVIDWVCRRCGCQMTVDVEGWPTVIYDHNKVMMEPNYCPNCGAKVVSL